MRYAEIKSWAYWFAMLFILLWMTGCRSAKPVTITETVTETITETVHDTVFKTEADSSAYRALIECINGKAVIREVTKAQPGKHLAPPKVSLEDNVLSADCEAYAQELLARWRSKNKTTSRVKEIPVYIEADLTWWQQTRLWAGNIFLLLLFVLLLKTIYNPFKFIKNDR